MDTQSRVKNLAKKFKSIVLWGCKNNTDSTYRHIHRHLYTILKKLDVPTLWCEDEFQNNKLVPSGSLVILHNLTCQFVDYKKDNYYVGVNNAKGQLNDVENKQFLNMRVYGEEKIGLNHVEWYPTVLFDKNDHMLHQTWATNLLPNEFLAPVFNDTKNVWWIGSIWNDINNAGNVVNINYLKRALIKNGLNFIHRIDITDDENIAFIRESRIAPAIGGPIQVTNNMIPCRLWKNISYGQLGITNLSKSLDIFNSNIIFNTKIDILIGLALSIQRKEYIDITKYQQDIVSKNHTYLNWFLNIFRAFDELGSR